MEMSMPAAVRRPSHLIEADLPEFGLPTVQPALPPTIHAARQSRALARALAAGFDALFVYADREHCANLAYLTGYDPRFEEAFAVLRPGAPTLLHVGVEGWTWSELAPGPFERRLYPPLSFLAMPRAGTLPLRTILENAGIATGQRIGAAGWKYYGPEDGGLDDRTLEIPAYMADALRAVVGPSGDVRNAGALFMNPRDGLRAVNEVEQLAVFEFAATHTSQHLRNVLFGLTAGMTELSAARLMGSEGLPSGAHTMLTAGPRARAGLASPSLRPIQAGDPMTMASCVHGALTARAGFAAAGPEDLAPAISDWLDKLAKPYFEAAVAWWETLAIGTKGRELHAAVHAIIGDPFFGVTLNVGHLIHIDEWLHSPVSADSDIPLVSGMALQLDIIPATGGPYHTANIEDGLALADAAMRAEFAARYPEAWQRIERRRAFMCDVIGIRLAPEVLPFSNIPAYLPPFFLAPRRVLAVA
jgi:Xaa-Pro aminopeptidase